MGGPLDAPDATLPGPASRAGLGHFPKLGSGGRGREEEEEEELWALRGAGTRGTDPTWNGGAERPERVFRASGCCLLRLVACGPLCLSRARTAPGLNHDAHPACPLVPWGLPPSFVLPRTCPPFSGREGSVGTKPLCWGAKLLPKEEGMSFPGRAL